jgi:hypothetical protein
MEVPFGAPAYQRPEQISPPVAVSVSLRCARQAWVATIGPRDRNFSETEARGPAHVDPRQVYTRFRMTGERRMDFSWCDDTKESIGTHSLHVLSARAADLSVAAQRVAAVVPGHYATEEHAARVLAILGKTAAANLIESKLPTTPQIRSGDLGEILSSEYIHSHTGYCVPIKRLRWKDHRNMAMRGDDVIGFDLDEDSELRLLKCEAKSRASLSASTLVDARRGLDKDGGLPSPHALTFISEQLVRLGDTTLADAIDRAQLSIGIHPNSVSHLMFVLAGNDPADLLRNATNGYGGGFTQLAVGVRIATHGEFIGSVYDRVISDAYNP